MFENVLCKLHVNSSAVIRLLRIETYLEITEFNGKTQQIVNMQKLLSQTFNLFDKTLKKMSARFEKKVLKTNNNETEFY